MNGLQWKTLLKMDDLGVPLFLETSICKDSNQKKTSIWTDWHCWLDTIASYGNEYQPTNPLLGCLGFLTLLCRQLPKSFQSCRFVASNDGLTTTQMD